MTETGSPQSLPEVKPTLGQLAHTIEQLLYQAREAHTHGVATYIPFTSLPQAWRKDLAAAALGVVMAESLERRQRADVAARAYVDRWLHAEALDVASEGAPFQQYTAREALSAFIRQITRGTGPSIVSEVLAAYQEALCR